jgi:hypothetical protein
MKSTISLFRNLYKSLPPLFPPEIKDKMGHALAHLEEDQTITPNEIEETIIIFGYEVWPWNRAYHEFFVMNENKMGEHFLVSKLNHETLKRYHDFKNYGGTLRDLHSGSTAEFFSIAERNNLRSALIEMQVELREFTDREVSSTEKIKYLNRVEEFTNVLASIKKILDELKMVASREQDHPALADEIRSQVRGFEYGLCALGPDFTFHAIQNSPDFFLGRKADLGRMRGIEVPGKFELND